VLHPPHKKAWRVILIRKRGEFLGYVEAPDPQPKSPPSGHSIRTITGASG
jgi:hypothetical protein